MLTSCYFMARPPVLWEPLHPPAGRVGNWPECIGARVLSGQVTASLSAGRSGKGCPPRPVSLGGRPMFATWHSVESV